MDGKYGMPAENSLKFGRSGNAGREGSGASSIVGAGVTLCATSRAEGALMSCAHDFIRPARVFGLIRSCQKRIEAHLKQHPTVSASPRCPVIRLFEMRSVFPDKPCPESS